MNYVFKDQYGDSIDVWMWDDDWHNIVNVNGKFDESINTDKMGKYFLHKNKKYYLDDYYKITYDELVGKINNNEWIKSDELTQMILNEGVNNIKIEIPLKYLSYNIDKRQEEIIIKCNIVEQPYDSYKIKDNYKIRVSYKINNWVNSRDFYTSDLTSLIRDKRFKIIKNERND